MRSLFRARIVLFVSVLLVGLASKSRATFEEDEDGEVKKAAPTRILFVGDVMLDGGPGNVVASGKDPFEHTSALFQDVDLAIANLECVIGRGGEQRLKPYVFRGASDSPRFLKKYFHAVGLANNHSMDFGPEGMDAMLDVLEKEELPYFGAGRNLKQANKPFLFESNGHKIAILAFNEFHAEEYAATKDTAGNAPLIEKVVTREIKRAKAELECDVVIPFLHWGEELMPEPRPDQREMARKWIDAGATAVIGAHPHITQTIETYRGAPIVYSLGNFAFDYFPVDPPEWTGWVAIVVIDESGKTGLEIRSVTLDPAGCPRISATE